MNLSKEQKRAISHVNGPALVLAVPGAGKTTVIIHRTANLILNHKVSPDKILSITFSKASARDMKERFNKLYKDKFSLPVHFSTIHSFSYSLVREYAFKNNLKYTLIENMDREVNKINILKSIYNSINQSIITEEKLENLMNYISYIKNMLITPEEFLDNFKIDIKNFKEIYRAYENYKSSNRFVDFDDMLTLSLEILKRDKHILNKYRSKYEYIQVDEGQDTSKVQMKIVKILSYPKNNLFIVADDDQSIYSFRGAYPKGLFELRKTYKDCKIFYMEQNYRSSSNIVSVCNKFIKKNTIRYDKNIYTENPYLEPISIVKVKSTEDQYYFLIEELTKHQKDDIAILYRNNLSSIGVIEHLERNNIDFHMRDRKLKFFNHWVIKDIMSFFMLSIDDRDMDSFENIYYKMKGFISKKQLNYIRTLNNSISVFDRLLKIPGLNSFYRNIFLDLKLEFKKLTKLSPYEGIWYIEKILGYEDYLREASKKFCHNFDTLKKIIDYLKIIAKDTKDLKEFTERLEYLEKLCNDSNKNKKGVFLSTIHSAKGLEFDRVYMLDLYDEEFPTTSSIDAFNNGDFHALEEERRLFYVGMTRAKSHLTLITMDDKKGEIKPSRFIDELEKLFPNC
ncbi:MAG: ATP-dependent helicase [Tissierellia bacterium]|nr:ATP-dependent helicase [Tissierellia bacterium]